MKRCKTLGSEVLALRADITDAAANERAIRTAGETFGRLDIVVANAGIAAVDEVGFDHRGAVRGR